VELIIKSHEGNKWGEVKTDDNGQTRRLWLQPTYQESDYYYAEVSLGPNLIFTSSAIKIQTGSKNVKLVTEWPPILDNLLTVEIAEYYPANNTTTFEDLMIELYDDEGEKIADSQINTRGKSYFSMMKVGNYVFKVSLKDEISGNWEDLISKEFTLDGSFDSLKINVNSQTKFEQKFPIKNYPQDHETGTKPKKFDCNCIAFRLDDVQDYRLNAAQLAIMNLFKEKNATLTIGVIGGAIGSDINLVNYIQSDLENEKPSLEIASHSWNNIPMTELSAGKQSEYIFRTSEKLSNIFGVTPSVFIPPANLFNNDTVRILQSTKFTHISYHTDEQDKLDSKDGLKYFPATVETAPSSKIAVWTYKDNELILNDIHKSLDKWGYATVMMHPSEFSYYDDGFYENQVNQTALTHLEEILDIVQTEGLQILPVSHIDSYDKPINLPRVDTTKTLEKNGCNCVAFRLDNVQDFYLNNVQLDVINLFLEREIPLSFGIFGKSFGNDHDLVYILKEKFSQHKDLLKVANRGWENIDHAKFGKDIQSASINKTNHKILDIFGEKSTIFIPPLKSFNKDTFYAMKENGISYFSSQTTRNTPKLVSDNSIPFQVPATISLEKLLEDNLFSAKGANEQAMDILERNLHQYGFAVVNMRTQDFAMVGEGEHQNQSDLEKLQRLESLLGFLNNSEIEIVGLNKIPQKTILNNSPSWVKNIFHWFDAKKITHEDIVNAIGYLKEQNLIKVNL